jgi:hypothetical protein
VKDTYLSNRSSPSRFIFWAGLVGYTVTVVVELKTVLVDVLVEVITAAGMVVVPIDVTGSGVTVFVRVDAGRNVVVEVVSAGAVSVTVTVSAGRTVV